MAVTIAIETPLQDDVRALVAELNGYLKPLSPPEFQFQLTVDQMAEPTTTTFVARNDGGGAVGLGALKRHDETLGEVKRMYSVPAVRGRGVGWRVLSAIEAKAREAGLARLVLETGSTPGFEPAWAIYERAGFTACGALLDYPDSEYNRFYEKALM